MFGKSLLSVLITFQLTSLTLGDPIYDLKKSFVAQLANFNFKDQVTKIRQNTNQVSVVHFYKPDGKGSII